MFSPLLAQATEPQGSLVWVDKIARTPVGVMVGILAILTFLRFLIFPYLIKTDPSKKSTLYSFARFFNELTDAIIYAGLAVFLIIRPYFVQTYYVPTGSMIPTIKEGDFLLTNKYSYRLGNPKIKDIAVFWSPKVGILNPNELTYIKRVIGTPGDTVLVKDGLLYRNGHRVEEPYLNDPIMMYDFKLVYTGGRYVPVIMMGGDNVNNTRLTAPAFRTHDPAMMRYLKKLPPVKIPKDHYIMMGDNRNGSYDSRSWGLVPRDAYIAKSEFIWLPFRNMGFTR